MEVGVCQFNGGDDIKNEWVLLLLVQDSSINNSKQATSKSMNALYGCVQYVKEEKINISQKSDSDCVGCITDTL
jgi:hypothetical protein